MVAFTQFVVWNLFIIFGFTYMFVICPWLFLALTTLWLLIMANLLLWVFLCQTKKIWRFWRWLYLHGALGNVQTSYHCSWYLLWGWRMVCCMQYTVMTFTVVVWHHDLTALFPILEFWCKWHNYVHLCHIYDSVHVILIMLTCVIGFYLDLKSKWYWELRGPKNMIL